MNIEEPILNDHNKQEYPPMHTVEHLLNQTMQRMFGCKRSIKTHIERKKSKINWDIDKAPTLDQIQEIEDIINDLIDQDLPVNYQIVNIAEIPEGISIEKLPSEASEMIRIVRIGDYDICPCIGAHVKSTAEIGRFKITSSCYNNGEFRIVYKVFPVENL